LHDTDQTAVKVGLVGFIGPYNPSQTEMLRSHTGLLAAAVLTIAIGNGEAVGGLVNIAVIGDSTCDTSHPGNVDPPQFLNVMGFGSLINTVNKWDYDANDKTYTYRGAEKNLALLWKPIQRNRTVGYVVSKCVLGLETWQFYEGTQNDLSDHSWGGTLNDTSKYNYSFLIWTLGENDRWCGWQCKDPSALFDDTNNVSCQHVVDGKTPCNDPSRTRMGKDYGGCKWPLDPVTGQVPGYCTNQNVDYNPLLQQCNYEPTQENTCLYKSYYTYTKKMLDEANGTVKSILVTPAPYMNDLDSFTYDSPDVGTRTADAAFHQQLDAMVKKLYHERTAVGDVVALLPLWEVLTCYYKEQRLTKEDFDKMRDTDEDHRFDPTRREYRHMTMCGALVHTYALLSLLNNANIHRIGQGANLEVVGAYWKVYCPPSITIPKLDTCLQQIKPLTPEHTPTVIV